MVWEKGEEPHNTLQPSSLIPQPAFLVTSKPVLFSISPKERPEILTPCYPSASDISSLIFVFRLRHFTLLLSSPLQISCDGFGCSSCFVFFFFFHYSNHRSANLRPFARHSLDNSSSWVCAPPPFSACVRPLPSLLSSSC